jgi:hypothetical protein
LWWFGGNPDSTGADPWSFEHRLVGRAVSAKVAVPADDDNLSWRLGANVTDMDPDAKAVLVGGSNANRTCPI